MADLSVLKNIVRTGRVSSVNAGNRTARVTFEDKGQSPLVSGELKVIKNPPFIPAKGAAQRTESESGGSGEAAFAAHSHAVKIAPCCRRRATMFYACISRRTTATGS